MHRRPRREGLYVGIPEVQAALLAGTLPSAGRRTSQSPEFEVAGAARPLGRCMDFGNGDTARALSACCTDVKASGGTAS